MEMKIDVKRFACWYALGVLVWVMSACGSDSSPAPASTLPTQPEALAAENNKSGGIYKGTIVGSSGVFVVRLQKGVKEISITLDGVTKKLTTTALDSWSSGQSIKNAAFTADDWQVVFSVGGTGTLPSLVVNIPGHSNAEVVILKELSTSIVTVYEGTFSGSSSGTWNFTIQAQVLLGAGQVNDGSAPFNFSGIVSGNSISLDTVIGKGTLSGDNASGTWQTSSPAGSGTWTGKRIL